MKNTTFIATGLLAISPVLLAQKNTRPNFVFILADDLGYGDLGCFGANDIKTPNIDRIAAEGIRFTEFYSASPVSSPSRAALLTGRYPQRMGINSVFFPESFTGMNPSEITIAELLKEQGYSTGIIGKWHLGHHHQFLPLQQGFNEYYGIPYSNDMSGVVYMNGNEVDSFAVNQKYITRTYTEKSVDFINRHKNKPFFLYIAHSMPHVPIYASENFTGTSGRGIYGDVIQELDWSVGQVMDALEKAGILENTVVFFTSDNGPWLVMRHLGGSAGPLREGKQTTFEGGMRVPAAAMWKNGIKPGTTCNELVLMMDIFPTFSHLAGTSLPVDRPIDGKDISILFDGKTTLPGREYLYIRYNEPHCYRYGNWKLTLPSEPVKATPGTKGVDAHPLLLHDLKADPGEKNNLAETFPDIVNKLKIKLDSAYKAMGTLPPSLIQRMPADHSHYEQLKRQ